MKTLQNLAVLSAGVFSLISSVAGMPAQISVSAEAETGTWQYDEETKTLTISGEWLGFYDGYGEETRPWAALKTSAEAVVFGDDVKRIPADAISGFQKVKSVTIPEGIEEIGTGAFSSCSSLEQITLPDSLKTIESYAFLGCSGLTSVTLPEQVTAIPSYAFEDCTSLTDVTIPEKAEDLGADVFKNTAWLKARRAENPLVVLNGILIDGTECKGAVQIPEGVKKIGMNAFSKNYEMTAVSFPDSLQSLSFHSFSECAALEKVVIPKQVQTVAEYAFFNCDNLKSAVIEDGVTGVGFGAFAACDKLSEIEIPESVNEIGGYAFVSTPWMEKQQEKDPLVVVNNILLDGTKCKNEVVIPDGIKMMTEYAFEHSELTSVVIPESIDLIPFAAFSSCMELKSVTIPASVETLDTNAFAGCENLSEVTIPATVKHFGYTVFADCEPTIKGYTGSAAETYAKENNLTFVAIGTPENEEKPITGDANIDGAVDISDAVLTSRFINADKNAVVTDSGLQNADVDGDGAVGTEDVTVMLQYIARTIRVFPANANAKA